MNGPAIVGQKLKEIREQKGLKSKDVAAALGMNKSTYSHYEQGERFPKLDTFYDICKYYDINPDYLFELSETPHRFTKQPSDDEREIAWKSAQEALEDAQEKLYLLSPR